MQSLQMANHQMTAPLAIVLAAGRSTRMKSDVPKVLHQLCGRPMIEYVLDAARAAGAEKMIVVVGHRADLVRDALAAVPDVVFVEQSEQKGTGHAVQMCAEELQDHPGSVLILAGDTPLLQGRSLNALLQSQQSTQSACVIGTATTTDNDGLGRVVRGGDGRFQRIVEQKDASPEECRITEINTGCYAFSTPLLLQSLQALRTDNAQGEYYLTDCPRILMERGYAVSAACSLTIEEALGVNTRVQLAEVRRRIQSEILQKLMLDGVTIEDPLQTSIDFGVSIGRDTIVRPFSVIEGSVTVGQQCIIGPQALIRGPATIPDGTQIR